MGSKSKQPAARLGDIGSKHGKYPPTPIMSGSGDVKINGRPAARQGDSLVPHTAPKKSPHGRKIAEGSGSVLINGKPAARVTDAISCGGKVSTGSGDVLIGDSPQLLGPAPIDFSGQSERDDGLSFQAAAPAPAPVPSTPPAQRPMPPRVYGGPYGSPANDPIYRRGLGWLRKAKGLSLAGLFHSEPLGGVTEWDDLEVAGRRYKHIGDQAVLEVYDGDKQTDAYRVRDSVLYDLHGGDVVATMDEQGNVTPLTESDQRSYKAYLAEGGSESYEEWVGQGRPGLGGSVPNSARLQQLIDEGHGVQRHGAQVTKDQLIDRAVYGKDPITGTTVDGVHGGTHQYAQHATKVTSDPAYVYAENYARNSQQFIDATTSSTTGRAQVEVPLKDIFGNNFGGDVFGITRQGSKAAPTGYAETVFGPDSTMIVRYKQNSAGDWLFNTMFPQPK